MKNEETKVTETKKGKESFAAFLSKTADASKKAAAGIQKGAQNLAEQTKKNMYEQRMKHYNPLFPDQFRSEDFRLPNVIEIVDDAVRKNIDVCEGAIGWLDTVNDVEILHLYDEWVDESGINFAPKWKCDCIYCVDQFDRNKYINMNSVFGMANEERLAELESIAYSLGAKMCSVEIVESDAELETKKMSAKAGGVVEGGASAHSKNASKQSGRIVSYFNGSDTPTRPTLKWFAHDDNIKGLIEMRCSDANSIKSKVLVLQGSSTSSVSRKIACAVDKMVKVKGSMSMEKQSMKEHSSKLIYEIEF